MTNALLGDVAATLGGRDLVLNYSVHAVTRLEALFGQTVDEIGKRWRTDKSLAFIRGMFWGAVLERQPEFDTTTDEGGVRRAGELLRLSGGAELPMLLVEAWALSWPVPPSEEAAPADPRPRPETAVPGIGESSSASGSRTTSGRRKSSSTKPRGS